jgi:hypothetical protein
VALIIRRRDGKTTGVTITLKPDPTVTIDDLAKVGTLTPEQRAFRESWLGARSK